MVKPSKNLENTVTNDKETQEALIESTIQAHFLEYAKSYKIKENAMYSALESLQNSINLMQKELNYKIGGMKSREARENKPEVFGTLEEAISKANEIRKSAGLEPLDVAAIEPKLL